MKIYQLFNDKYEKKLIPYLVKYYKYYINANVYFYFFINTHPHSSEAKNLYSEEMKTPLGRM